MCARDAETVRAEFVQGPTQITGHIQSCVPTIIAVRRQGAGCAVGQPLLAEHLQGSVGECSRIEWTNAQSL